MIGDNFMWFPEKNGSTVAGETTDSFFARKKAFEVFNFTFMIDNKDSPEAPVGKAGSAAGKAKFQEFEIEKDVDTASVPLYKACCLGTMIPTIMLALRKVGGSNLVYLQYIFRYAHVTGITWHGGTGDQAATERMTFSFKAMGIQYVAQKSDGTAGLRQAWSWNTATQNDKGGSPSLEIEGVESAPDFLSPHL